MADQKISWVKHGNKIVGKDTTRYSKSGFVTTTHQTARSVWGGIGGVQVGRITGTTTHKGGKTTYKKNS